MEVQIFFESRNENVDRLRDMAMRRAKFATRRLTWLVPRAELTLSNTGGTYGGVEKCCQARLQTDGAGVVVARSVARDWRVAVDNALTCAVRRLMRQWRRA
jgi:hypothetical protein